MPYRRKTLWRWINPFRLKVFRKRNIIIVSEGEVKHYPLSGALQCATLFAIMGALSWGSYSTGSYFAAQNILKEKERKLETTTLLNRRIEEQYTLLKRDLDRLNEKEDAQLTEYDRFVIAQHHKEENPPRLDDTGLNNLGQNLLQDRIDYLEGLVEQLKTDRETLVSSIQERTKEQITVYENILKKAGINVARLVQHKDARAVLEEIEKRGIPEAQRTLLESQGGPYIPLNPTAAMLGLEKQETEMHKNINYMVLLGTLQNQLPFIAPMKQYRITSGFGRRIDPLNKRWAAHRGMDFVNHYGAKIHATAPGRVVTAERTGAYGNMVELDHGFGITSRYAHMKSILVKEGDVVARGEIIGTQGNTGRSTGTHLHYEIRMNKVAVNPRNFIEAGNDFF